MASIESTIDDFLEQKRIAVVGVSRTTEDAANLIYRKLKQTGYEVFPVNPNAESFDGDPCYPSVKAIPGGVEGAVLVVKPEVSTQVVKDCADAGVKRVWMHRSLVGGGSVSQAAVDFGREKHMEIIAGGCPMMFCEPVDFGHKCMKWFTRLVGKMPA